MHTRLPKPKLSKTLKYLSFSACYIGNTRDLLKLNALGYELRYEVTRGAEYRVRYEPRFRTDPKPWVQIGGLQSRLSSGEVGAYAGHPLTTTRNA